MRLSRVVKLASSIVKRSLKFGLILNHWLVCAWYPVWWCVWCSQERRMAVNQHRMADLISLQKAKSTTSCLFYYSHLLTWEFVLPSFLLRRIGEWSGEWQTRMILRGLLLAAVALSYELAQDVIGEVILKEREKTFYFFKSVLLVIFNFQFYLGHLLSRQARSHPPWHVRV